MAVAAEPLPPAAAADSKVSRPAPRSAEQRPRPGCDATSCSSGRAAIDSYSVRIRSGHGSNCNRRPGTPRSKRQIAAIVFAWQASTRRRGEGVVCAAGNDWRVGAGRNVYVMQLYNVSGDVQTQHVDFASQRKTAGRPTGKPVTDRPVRCRRQRWCRINRPRARSIKRAAITFRLEAGRFACCTDIQRIPIRQGFREIRAYFAKSEYFPKNCAKIAAAGEVILAERLPDPGQHSEKLPRLRAACLESWAKACRWRQNALFRDV